MALSSVRGRVITRIPALIGWLRSSSSSSSAASGDAIEDLQDTSLGSREGSDDEIKCLTSYITTRIDDIVKFGKPPLPYVYAAEVYLDQEVRIPDNVRWKVLSKVTHLIQNIPQVDTIQIFHAKIFYRSMLNDDNERDLTKDDIISRVVNVTQSYPKVGDNKVTEETHFVEDLRFDRWDIAEIIQALQMEFKLYIPDGIVSCKLAIEYIFNHRAERLPKEEFRKHVFLTGEFGESKSELRRMFVRDKETETNYDYSDSLHHAVCPNTLNWNGFKPTQHFRSLRYRSSVWTEL